MIHRSLFGRAGWGRFSGLVGGAYGRCSTATNDTTPTTDFSYTLQSAADVGVAAHGPIKKWGRFGGFRATARATATWAPTAFSRPSRGHAYESNPVSGRRCEAQFWRASLSTWHELPQGRAWWSLGVSTVQRSFLVLAPLSSHCSF